MLRESHVNCACDPSIYNEAFFLEIDIEFWVCNEGNNDMSESCIFKKICFVIFRSKYSYIIPKPIARFLYSP